MLTYVIVFIGLGVLMLITMFLQVNIWFLLNIHYFDWLKSFLFAISGEALTQRLRGKVFRTLLKQEVGYFDHPENNTGALCTRLATEASAVQGVKNNKNEFFISIL